MQSTFCLDRDAGELLHVVRKVMEAAVFAALVPDTDEFRKGDRNAVCVALLPRFDQFRLLSLALRDLGSYIASVSRLRHTPLYIGLDGKSGGRDRLIVVATILAAMLPVDRDIMLLDLGRVLPFTDEASVVATSRLTVTNQLGLPEELRFLA